jgi:glycosyltransferase involved in cell wall biosynthesis
MDSCAVITTVAAKKRKVGRVTAVSVVIPVFNKAHAVAETLRSALAQTLHDVEFLVIDDGSTDGSSTVLAGFDDPRLIIIQQANQGVSVARNRGIMAARNPWIAFLDADDLWDPDHLARLLGAVNGSDVVAAFANVRLESAWGEPLLDRRVSPQRIDDYFAFALRHGGYVSQTSAMVVRKDHAVAAGLFTPGEKLGEDIDLWSRLALRGPMLYTAALTATYNDRPQASSAARDLKQAPHAPPFAKSLQRLLEAGDVPQRLKKNAKRYVNFLMLEYARQQLDRGLFAEARQTLLRACNPVLDPKRYTRRLLRSFRFGQFVFEKARSRSEASGST